MEAFSRAFAGAQQARTQQEAQRALVDERQAQTAERLRATAAANKAAFEEDTLTKLFSSGQPIDPKAVYSIVGPTRGADILKGLSALQEQNIKTDTALKSHIGALVGGVDAMPIGMRPAAYIHVRDSLIQRGLAKPDDLPDQYLPEYVAGVKKWALTAKEQFDQEAAAARDKIAATKAAAELPGITADAAVKSQVAAGTVGGLTPEQQRTAQTAAGQLAVSRGQLGVAQQREKREQQKEDLMTGAGVGPDGKPLPENPVARAIAEYRVPPPSPRSLSTGPGQALMRQVEALNPNFNATEFPNRQKTRIAFTTGDQGKKINAINTAIGHLDQLGTAVDALGNTDVQLVNQAKNFLTTQFGGASVTNFDTIKDALAGEVSNVLSNSGATVAGIADAQKHIKDAGSPAQLAGYMKTQIPILGSKLASYDYQYHQAMGDKDPFSALSPEVKGILVKHGFDPAHPTIGGGGKAASGTIRARDPQGQLHEAPAGTALPAGWTKEGG